MKTILVQTTTSLVSLIHQFLLVLGVISVFFILVLFFVYFVRFFLKGGIK